MPQPRERIKRLTRKTTKKCSRTRLEEPWVGGNEVFELALVILLGSSSSSNNNNNNSSSMPIYVIDAFLDEDRVLHWRRRRGGQLHEVGIANILRTMCAHTDDDGVSVNPRNLGLIPLGLRAFFRRSTCSWEWFGSVEPYERQSIRGFMWQFEVFEVLFVETHFFLPSEAESHVHCNYSDRMEWPPVMKNSSWSRCRLFV